jgi:hypothetical protein
MFDSIMRGVGLIMALIAIILFTYLKLTTDAETANLQAEINLLYFLIIGLILSRDHSSWTRSKD